MTAKEHNRMLGIFFAVHAGLQAFGLTIAALVYGGLGAAMASSGRRDERMMGTIFIVAAVVVFFLMFVIVIPQVLAAFKILKNKSGARFWAIFGAIVSLMSFPFGTALGVYALWFLFGEQGKTFYQTTQSSGGSGGSNTFSPPPPSNWQ